MTLYLGSDHAGHAFKERAKKLLAKLDYPSVDLGNARLDEKDDYPKYGALVGRAVREDRDGLGILFCGTGTGMCIAANKIKGVRAASATTVQEARLSREHNAANVLCLGQRLIPWWTAKKIILAWLDTPESYEPRHVRRVRQLNRL